MRSRGAIRAICHSELSQRKTFCVCRGVSCFDSCRCIALPFLAPSLAARSAKRALRSDDVYRLRDVHDAQRSPDGKWVAYTVSTVHAARDCNVSDFRMVRCERCASRQS